MAHSEKHDPQTSGFCGEIQYGNEIAGWTHSDICWHKSTPVSTEYRLLLHECLDEWLDRSNGTGAFWIGDHEYFVGWGG